MLVNITEVKITSKYVSIKGQNLEAQLLQDDLFSEDEAPIVIFRFPRDEENPGPMKYLYKVVTSQKRCESAKSMGEKLERLNGAVITLADGFIIKQ